MDDIYDSHKPKKYSVSGSENSDGRRWFDNEDVSYLTRLGVVFIVSAAVIASSYVRYVHRDTKYVPKEPYTISTPAVSAAPDTAANDTTLSLVDRIKEWYKNLP